VGDDGEEMAGEALIANGGWPAFAVPVACAGKKLAASRSLITLIENEPPWLDLSHVNMGWQTGCLVQIRQEDTLALIVARHVLNPFDPTRPDRHALAGKDEPHCAGGSGHCHLKPGMNLGYQVLVLVPPGLVGFVWVVARQVPTAPRILRHHFLQLFECLAVSMKGRNQLLILGFHHSWCAASL
jgi:hypothetical protein